ncbi:PREDICTED: serine/threonine-protein kinase pelle [Polistes dominula]|uniref:Serine/threonine-protein kinase pelle n=1 Tax=Polistes dominula TaxID=743375 RepID=A0ABM1II95_POLDO|nr:PREDICTED: serine/threonine-protein kinase pelle [Polistes dominula]
MTSLKRNVKYIYQLPALERFEICKILDRDDEWEELAGKWMQYDVSIISSLQKQKSPTNELLKDWGLKNHTILELFILLLKMKQYKAMTFLKPFVDTKFHCLLNNDNDNHSNIPNNQQVTEDVKDLKIGIQNFNQKISPRPNARKIIVDENTEQASHKIINQSLDNLQSVDVSSNTNNLLVPSLANRLLSLKLNKSNSKKSQLSILRPEATLPRVPYSELETATNGWLKHNILGKGGFGVVYRGTWKNTNVAIKRLEYKKSSSDESYLIQLKQSLKEIEILNSYPHENILLLYAYCLDGQIPCLVYQLMENGSLEDNLLLKNKSRPLSWLQRHEIAKGTARGLQYLHTIGEKPLIHGDIKSANILLNKNYEPKIGDFGLAKEGDKNSIMVSRIHGTRPYLPDDFIYGKQLSTKIDTYSYGIVLFELATGLQAYDNSRPKNKFLKEFIDHFEDQHLHLLIDNKAGEEDKQVYSNFIVLGKWCSNRLAKDRPEMELVFRKLDDL